MHTRLTTFVCSPIIYFYFNKRTSNVVYRRHIQDRRNMKEDIKKETFSLGLANEVVPKKVHLLKAWCSSPGLLRRSWIRRALATSMDWTSDEYTIEQVTRRLGLVRRSRVLPRLPRVYLVLVPISPTHLYLWLAPCSERFQRLCSNTSLTTITYCTTHAS